MFWSDPSPSDTIFSGHVPSHIWPDRPPASLHTRSDMSPKSTPQKTADVQRRQTASLNTPTDLKAAATKDIAGAMNAILADEFALYLKTKNFHWHISGPHFRDYHLLLD